ncbi:MULTISPECIES: hypothetical protein [Empedobacter]|uniref:Polysaccharide chain length determinant N-terminal domain-containing protein n=1 Tax=Empedobacter stercoris TaxID=1628248 RepID=A0ABX1WM05_9FLAO|nr:MULTISPECIES: hypothetical protein [Empedobacter]MBY0065572.1 hypothetical protein [Empedobacter falsenii]NOJ75630.1 hypothetical protein [Empedobacter stercoris]
MNNNSTQQENNEIDFGNVISKFSKSFEKLFIKLSQFSTYLISKKYIFLIILIIGVTFGYILDKTTCNYEYKLFVKAKYGYVDNLYNKIDLINSKFTSKDTVFLKKNGLLYDGISKIEIEPVVDPYEFGGRNEANLELMKTFSEDIDLKKIINETDFYKNYPNHSIIIKSSSQYPIEKFKKSLSAYLNNNPILNELMKITLTNDRNKLKFNESTIAQIDTILNDMSKNKGSQSLVITAQSQVGDMLAIKDDLAKESTFIKVGMFEGSSFYNILDSDDSLKKLKSNNYKFLIPVIFLFFTFFYFLLVYLKKSISKRILEKS